MLQPTLDEIEAVGARGGVLAGVPTGFTDLDAAHNGLHPGQMIVVAADRRLGKSTLGLDFARSGRSGTAWPASIFSLEMSKHRDRHAAAVRRGAGPLPTCAPAG